MTFPQLKSSDAVIGGQEFWRLRTLLASAGDLYESDVGALAFALGPDSDIATVMVSYYDPDNTPTLLSQVTLSPDRSMVGRIDAHGEASYPGGRKGRILISVEDIYNPNFRPFGSTRGGVGGGVAFDPVFDAITFETPVLDVLQYFGSPPSLVPQRSDKTFRLQYLPVAPQPAAGGITWVAFPAFGRKSGVFSIAAGGSVGTVQMRLVAAKLSAAGVTIPGGANQKTLIAAVDMLPDAVQRYSYKASVDGLWDLFLIGLGGATGAGFFPYNGVPFPIDITLSDDIL